MLDAAGIGRAAIVGHDWGAAVAWWLGLAHPERVSRLAVLNVPHPAVMRRYLLSSPRQALRSWYIFFFQLPRLPERFLARDDFANLARAVRGGRRGTCTDEDLDPIKKKYLYADISLGVGLVALGVGTYLMLAPGGKSEAAAARAKRLRVDVAPHPGGGFASVSGLF